MFPKMYGFMPVFLPVSTVAVGGLAFVIQTSPPSDRRDFKQAAGQTRGRTDISLA
jgi:hypothetical protein